MHVNKTLIKLSFYVLFQEQTTTVEVSQLPVCLAMT